MNVCKSSYVPHLHSQAAFPEAFPELHSEKTPKNLATTVMLLVTPLKFYALVKQNEVTVLQL